MRRTNLGIGNAAFAGDLDISVDELESFEIGDRTIDARMLQRMGKALFVSPMYFFRQEPDDPLTLGSGKGSGEAKKLLPEELGLGSAVRKITDPELRKEIMSVVEALVQACPKYRS
jgi:hypothetical protein